MCCCCCHNIHRHQIHLISYGFVAFILILTGLVFTIFAIFQKDSQIGKIWLAGPTTMVVGLVLCGKVIIDWSPAMHRGRHNSLDSIFDEEMALMTPRINKRYVPLTSQESRHVSISSHIRCQNVNCNCPHHVGRSPTAFVNREYTNSTPISIYSQRNLEDDSQSPNSTAGTKNNSNKFNFNQTLKTKRSTMGYQENNEVCKKYNYESIPNKLSNHHVELGKISKCSHQLPISQNRRLSSPLTNVPNSNFKFPSKLSLNLYSTNKLTNNTNNNDPTHSDYCNLSSLTKNKCRNSNDCSHNLKNIEQSLSHHNSQLYTNKPHRIGPSKIGKYSQILSSIRPTSPMSRCITSSLFVTPEPSTIEEESFCNSTFLHNCLCTQEYGSNSPNSGLELKKEGTSSSYSSSSVISGNEMVGNENHSCYQGETFIFNEHKYLI
uniref:Transmembrane protein 220 n=1 Tax=Strongyloides venezuelensis TaxID=75913 RepID=A0A0K0FE59_STRVS